MLFQDLGPRKVVADFSGGRLSSDGGALLLRQVDAGLGLSRALSRCFVDHRRADLIEHSVEELLCQRLQGLALGYEDLNDHRELRRNPLLAATAGKVDVLGQERRCPEHRGFALASPATLNRLELSAEFSDYYRKIQPQEAAVGQTLLEMGVRCLPKDAEVLVLDFDATDDPLHGQQEGRFFHGYYGQYCYLPLFCFCGDVVLWAQLRTSDRDASDGTLEALQQIVAAIRARFPKVKIVVRADSGFARDGIMQWCEAQQEVYYLIGLARNARLEAILGPTLWPRGSGAVFAGEPCASSRSFPIRRSTPGPGPAHHRQSRSGSAWRQPAFYRHEHSARRIARRRQAGIAQRGRLLVIRGGLLRARTGGEPDQTDDLDLKSDRTSTHWLASNQMRLWLSAFAYLLLERLRAWGLRGTEMARASLGTLRLRLLKVAAQVSVSVRRVYVQLCSAFPLQELFAQCQRRLAEAEASSA